MIGAKSSLNFETIFDLKNSFFGNLGVFILFTLVDQNQSNSRFLK